MINIIGDFHDNISKITKLCKEKKLGNNDTIILLGDTGLDSVHKNFTTKLKKQLSELPVTILCVRGEFDAFNKLTYTDREMRQMLIPDYKVHDENYKQLRWKGGKVDQEEQYPNILYAADGEIFIIEDKLFLLVGGACMQDKQLRSDIYHGDFTPDKPLADVIKKIDGNLELYDNKVDYVLSHTCPYEYMPYEKYIPDTSTAECFKRHWENEKLLSDLRKKIVYEMWLCGHFHIDRTVGNVRFLHNDIYEIK